MRERHLRIFDGQDVKVNIQFEPRDLWVGLFWRRTDIALHLLHLRGADSTAAHHHSQEKRINAAK